MEYVNDEVFSEFDNDKVAENDSRVEEETLGQNGPIVLVGMMFNDEKEVFDFMRYAYDVGFPVRRRNSKRGDNGLLKYVTLTYVGLLV